MDDLVHVKYDTRIPKESKSVHVVDGKWRTSDGNIIEEYAGFVYSIDRKRLVISQKHPKHVTCFDRKKRFKINRIESVEKLVCVGDSLEKQLSS